MMNTHYRKFLLTALLLILIMSLVSCSQTGTSPTLVQKTTYSLPTATNPPPTETPIPAAATVNGENILLSDYLSEILRYQDAQATLKLQSTLEEQQETVMNDMINQALLAQAAFEGGYSITDSEFESYQQNLIQQSGGEDAFQEWMSNNHYDIESFTRLLKISLAAAWQRDQITQSVPLEAEQVSVMQILVFDEALAQSIHSQLENGSDFEVLAFMYEPESGGWLGWFPKGFLMLKEIEEAAFTLQPGEYSEVIETSYGYHILYLIESDPQRTLSSSALDKLRENAVEEWLQNARTKADIEIIAE